MLQTVMYMVLSMLVDWRLTLISLAIGGFITLALNKLVRSARKAGRNQTRRTQSLVQRLSDTLIGVKLLKAYKKDGRQFGVMQLHLEFPLTALAMGNMKVPFAEGSKFIADATMDGCIDGSLVSGSTKFRGQIDGRADIAQGDMSFKLTLAATMSGQETERELSKQ